MAPSIPINTVQNRKSSNISTQLPQPGRRNPSFWTLSNKVQKLFALHLFPFLDVYLPTKSIHGTIRLYSNSFKESICIQSNSGFHPYPLCSSKEFDPQFTHSKFQSDDRHDTMKFLSDDQLLNHTNKYWYSPSYSVVAFWLTFTATHIGSGQTP